MTRYKTDSQIAKIRNRVGSKELEKRNAIAAKWEPVDNNLADGTCANIRVMFDEGQAMLTDFSTEPKFGTPEHDALTWLHAQISPGLMLYRLVLLFKTADFEKIDDYKQVWELTLRHKESGEIANLYDYKGGCSMGLKETKVENLNPQFAEDLKELLTALVSKWLPLNYDGTVAGTVA